MTITDPKWKDKLEELFEEGDYIKPEQTRQTISAYSSSESPQRFYKRFEYNREGDKNRETHENYLDYCYFLINSNFSGMPGAMNKKTGRLYPTTPDRESDNVKERRREWWRKEAEKLDVDTDKNGWMTELARELNPTGECVCQTCGQTLDIRTVYLNKFSTSKFNELLPEDEKLAKTQSIRIFEAVDILIEEAGEDGYKILAECFEELELVENSRSAYKKKIEQIIDNGNVTPRNRWLSPGKMGDPPDRLDGLHSYGSPCCRPYEDEGRDPDNMQRYGRERRAYEEWVDGRWSGADRLMKLTETGKCQASGCETVEPLSADHIGPISLGFKHDPANLQGLCDSCNSAKRNELPKEDVEQIIEIESNGTPLASRHIQELWNECKHEIKTENDTTEIKRLLRNNQHQCLWALEELRNEGAIDLLISLLDLGESKRKYVFSGVDPESLNYDSMTAGERSHQQELNRASSSTRVAFESLLDYSQTDESKRWAERVDSGEIEKAWSNLMDAIDTSQNEIFVSQLQQALSKLEADPSPDTRGIVQQSIKTVYQEYGYTPPDEVTPAIRAFERYMDAVGSELVTEFR